MKPLKFLKCYNMVSKLADEFNLAEDLYEMYKKKIFEMLAMVEKALQTKTGSTNSFLIEYVDQWRKFTFFTYAIRKVFKYLDRFYLK